MKKLITYDWNDFDALKKSFESQKKVIIPISKVLDFNFNKKMEFSSDFIYDIGVLKDFSDFSSNLLYLFEEMFDSIEDDLIFISDIKSKEFQYKMRNLFDDIQYFKANDSEDSCKKDSSTERIKKIVDLSQKDIIEFSENFSKQLLGHDTFKETLVEKLSEYRLFYRIGEQKIFSLFLMGDSGVGKTEVARIFSRLLSKQKYLGKINFGNYSSKDALNSLIGSPRGYVGSEEGELFNKLDASDSGILLIDEFEKADSAVFNYFLEVLENGKATNSMGREYDLSGYIIVFTSNVSDKDYSKKFSPELRSRFNYVSSFMPLSKNDKDLFCYARLKHLIQGFNKSFEVHLAIPEQDWLLKKIQTTNIQNLRYLKTKVNQVFLNYIKDNFGEQSVVWK
ncbi:MULTISPECIES: AAA family ATPase [Lactococcus]|uniref:ATP-dependent Clp protease ATP-binding subunit ClpA, clpA n=1 Tax=Lactococcus lactis subsp. cremoris TaxID=1359 RepID=A0ABR5EGG2_LACLC|nr:MULTISPECIES: AAA family ATPase [Lactococcus]KKW72456.1 ATP-dependent Clp protease ATP-binding subunit ClpA, clpA [Lactococcus cremoris]MDM7510300.1 AAA family ATPase [Lactococcus lactis]TNU82526.1 ATP-dependent Clp protease ATP-binding subunit [Lactococcus cremoris]